MKFSDRIFIGIILMVLLAVMSAVLYFIGWWSLLIIPILLCAYTIGTFVDGEGISGMKLKIRKDVQDHPGWGTWGK